MVEATNPTGTQMLNNNSVYTVTPPDLTLNTIGPSVLLLGVDLENSKPFSDVYDKLFPEVEITFFVGTNGFEAKHAPWFRAVAGMASSIFVNLDNVSLEEVFLAMQAEHDDRAVVYWISQNKVAPVIVGLLNSYQYLVYNSLDEIEEFLVGEHIKNA